MKTRTNEAKWNEKEARWRISVQSDGVRRTFSCSTPGRNGKAECHAKAERWLRNQTINDQALISDLYQQWIQSMTSEHMQEKADILWRNWISLRIGKKRISALTEGDLQRIIDDMARAGRARKTLEHLRFNLTAFVKYCRINRATTLFPESLTVPKNAPSVGKNILSPEDLHTLFSHELDDLWHIEMYRFAVLTGVRPGELLGLKWTDVKNEKVYISRSINSKNQITAGKNDNARRVIALPSLAVQALDAQRKKLRAAGLVTPWVFPANTGDHGKSRTIEETWRSFIKKHNITPTSPYCWRHTYVSVNNDMPDGIKKRVVGHSKNMDTEGVYGHQIRGEIEVAAEYTERAFDRILSR